MTEPAALIAMRAWMCSTGWVGTGRPRCRIREPPKVRPVGVMWAVGSRVVVLKTKWAAGDRMGPASERLVVKARIRYWPIEVFFGQGFAYICAAKSTVGCVIWCAGAADSGLVCMPVGAHGKVSSSLATPVYTLLFNSWLHETKKSCILF